MPSDSTRARPARSARRFYETVSLSEAGGGVAVGLDGRALRTPAGRELRLPNRMLAEAVSREWADAGEDLDVAGMRLTKLANSAVDQVAGRRDAVVDEIAAYAETDLVCHRAAEPDDLRRRQDGCWTPLVDWIGERHGVALEVAEGVLPRPQAPAALLGVRAAVAGFGDFGLAGLRMAAAACGSAVVALALADGRIDAAGAWEASLLDELWQAEGWGEDPDAARRRAGLLADVAAAARFLELCDGA